MDSKAYKLLIRSFDAELNANEQSYLTRALKNSSDLEAERKCLEAIRSSAARSRVESFGSDFSGKVMRTILSRTSEEYTSFLPTLWAAFRPVALVSAVVIMVLASVSFYTLRNGHNKGIDQVITIVEEANVLFLEEQLCMQQKRN